MDATNNRVGIGTTTPEDSLHIYGGNLLFTGVMYPSILAGFNTSGDIVQGLEFRFQNTSNTTRLREGNIEMFGTGLNGVFGYLAHLTIGGPSSFYRDGYNSYLNTMGGFFGIGLSTPMGNLHVDTNNDSYDCDVDLLAPEDCGIGHLLTATTTDDLLFNGNLGVGTTTPATKLVIYGAATSTVSVISETALKGGRIILEDSDGAGCTEIYTLNGVITSAIVACPSN